MRTACLLGTFAFAAVPAFAAPLEAPPRGELLRPVSVEDLKRDLDRNLPLGTTREKAETWLRDHEITFAASTNGPKDTTLMGFVPTAGHFSTGRGIVVTLMFGGKNTLYMSQVVTVEKPRPRPLLKLPPDWKPPK